MRHKERHDSLGRRRDENAEELFCRAEGRIPFSISGFQIFNNAIRD
jgi:hypothetical protein